MSDLDHDATPTPVEEVARMTRPERQARLEGLVASAHQIVEDALQVHLGGRTLVSTAVLFSGGNDSTVLAHLFRDRADVAIHANTTVGIEATRQFVRDTCQEWGLPLLEETPETTYRDLVLDQGFPGPAQHFKMYQRLKERGLRQARRRLVTNGRRQRVLFLAGRRREESARRAQIPLHERVDSVIWASPLALWTKLDMNTYRLTHGDVPRNEVTDHLHMSGECLCGAFARPGELELIAQFYPETARELVALEAEVRAAGHPSPRCFWGHGKGKNLTPQRVGALCSSCADPTEGRSTT